MYNKIEQLEFKLEKNIGIEKHAGKVRKSTMISSKLHIFWECHKNMMKSQNIFFDAAE